MKDRAKIEAAIERHVAELMDGRPPHEAQWVRRQVAHLVYSDYCTLEEITVKHEDDALCVLANGAVRVMARGPLPTDA